MRHILLLFLALTLFGMNTGSAQAPAISERDLDQLVQEIHSQQARITENQNKIDAKMAEVIEAVRVARIFAGRGGK